MAPKKKAKRSTGPKTDDYRHTKEKRKNIPPAKIASEGKIPRVERVRYSYNPHLPPVLRSDPTGEADDVLDLVEEAKRRMLRPNEADCLREALQHYQPWLEWAGKREQHERGHFEVDPVALHIHERISTNAIVRAAMREDVQRDMFADPEQPYQEAVQFYRHDVDWANRLILGDSLQVMSSLARRENLMGKVQMIYIDPPYGIRFASNFQPLVGKRSVKDQESDMTREPEMVKAYCDTWVLGVHSYLAYLRDRLAVARELLAASGSIFVQISDEQVHRVRMLLDDVFGPSNFVSLVTFQKTSGATTLTLPTTSDYLLWYAKDIANLKFSKLYLGTRPGAEGATEYKRVETRDGEILPISTFIKKGELRLPEGSRILATDSIVSKGGDDPDITFGEGPGSITLSCRPNRHWKPGVAGIEKLWSCGRLLHQAGLRIYRRYFNDFPYREVTHVWSDTRGEDNPSYVVQTSTKVVERCVLMTTDPGDLVLDPTCGSGTTAHVAEQWGRRWMTVDTSRVALAIARQRLLTAKYEYYKLRDPGRGPSGGFFHATVPHITLKSITQNQNLDPIFAKHERILDAALGACNKALGQVSEALRGNCRTKLLEKQTRVGKRAITDADRRRWELPRKGGKWEHWEVPFDIDPDWPKALQGAVTAYRKACRAKMDEVNACIAANVEQEELVDQLEVERGILRVSGPFTIEGVFPEELSLGEEGLSEATPNEFDEEALGTEVQNIRAYLTRMVGHLRQDGVTFLGNKQRRLARLEPLFEHGTGSLIHAEGVWEDGDPEGPNTVAVTFGPQYGPVTAKQVEEFIHEAKRYDDLVVAGFSYDAAATAAIQEAEHPKKKIHQAHISNDINPAMAGLLKDTPRSQLFSVFGQPEIELKITKKGEWVVILKGMDIYDPVENVLRATGAEKVAAWFLDSDYDGRCFCITQAFFPDQSAWEKIAKALGSAADPDAFEAFKGTTSLPFAAGKHSRIAVKVIDPRGNEVMTVRKLEA